MTVAIGISRATMANIGQNLALAFGYNAIGIPLAAGLLYPFFAVVSPRRPARPQWRCHRSRS